MPDFEWDQAKAEANLRKHGLPFSAATLFQFKTAVILDDERYDYGEHRQIAIGFVGNRLCVLAFTKRLGRTRIISLRKANAREERRYVDDRASRRGRD